MFVGTALTAPVAAKVHHATGHWLALPEWRMAPLHQWHVTALFIGERPAAEVPGIMERLERVAGTTEVITLHHGRLLTMPETRPTMLWLRFDPAEALTRLHAQLADVVPAAPSPHVPYWPHVTIARVRGKAEALPPGTVVLDTLVIDQLTLFRSDPGHSGTVHTPLATYPLLSQRGPTAPVAAS